MTPNARFLLTGCQTDQTIGQFARIAIDRKFGIPSAEDNATFGTRRGTFFAETGSTKFAREERSTTGLAHDFSTIVALIHVFAFLAQEGIASIADAYFMIGLEFMAPVTIDTNKGMTSIATNLDLLSFGTVEASCDSSSSCSCHIGNRR
jgi:hypothetical protein